MWKNLALSPFAVLIAMTIWASIFGIVWIIIAIPVVAISQIFIRDYMNRKR
jgi:predicted PurR-regulated permease PerM